MKHKIIPAYLPESSHTVRITPNDIGVLLSKCTPEQIKDVLEAWAREVKLYKPIETTIELNNIVEDFAKDGKLLPPVQFELTCKDIISEFEKD